MSSAHPVHSNDSTITIVRSPLSGGSENAVIYPPHLFLRSDGPPEGQSVTIPGAADGGPPHASSNPREDGSKQQQQQSAVVELQQEDPRMSTDSEELPRPRVSMKLANLSYFGNYFGLSAVGPYYGLLLQAIGYTPGQVGILAALQPLCLVVLLPPLAFIADTYRCSKSIVTGAIFASCLFLLLVTLNATSPTSTTTNTTADGVEEKSLVVPAICVILHFMTITPIDPFLDYHVMAFIPPHQKNEWGTIRSYGGYGWGIGALLAAQLNSYVGWYWAAAQYIIGRMCTVIGFFYAKPYNPSAVESNSMRYVEVLKFVLTRQRLALFLLCACFMGIRADLHVPVFVFKRARCP